jgi:hypothetical protein
MSLLLRLLVKALSLGMMVRRSLVDVAVVLAWDFDDHHARQPSPIARWMLLMRPNGVRSLSVAFFAAQALWKLRCRRMP